MSDRFVKTQSDMSIYIYIHIQYTVYIAVLDKPRCLMAVLLANLSIKRKNVWKVRHHAIHGPPPSGIVRHSAVSAPSPAFLRVVTLLGLLEMRLVQVGDLLEAQSQNG